MGAYNIKTNPLGNKIIMKILKNKKIHISIILIFIILIIILLYPFANSLLLKLRNNNISYSYSLPKNFEIKDVSKLPIATAVPILTYHGIVKSKDLGENTNIKTFVSQLEALKQNGYQTISIKEYDLFRQNKYVLPAKPIIITFDDGRKDSFYPVDDILKKLGFNAVIFVATVKANENDLFYLNWDELKKVKETGRWEIEAHGRNSHDYIQIDQNGNTNREYLVSYRYDNVKGLETKEEFEKRVEEDYLNGINDIKKNLDIDARYFAVPLNDYGGTDGEIHKDGYEFNEYLTSKYFKLAFVQSKKFDGLASETFYNYSDSNSFKIKRLAVENMSADDLIMSLDKFSPQTLPQIFIDSNTSQEFIKNIKLLYGQIDFTDGIKLISSTTTQSTRAVIGDIKWKNYSVKANLIREKGRSVSLLVNYVNENNFIILNWGEESLKIIERVKGIDKVIASYYPWNNKGSVEILVRVNNGYITAYFSELLLAKVIPIKSSGGMVGFGVWDTEGAQSTIKSLEITSL